MSRHFYKFILRRFLTGALAVCTGVIANSRDEYLAAAGPTPLRFRLEVARLDPAKALPPLKMGNEASTNAMVITNTVSAELPGNAAPGPDGSVSGSNTITVPEGAPTTPEEPIYANASLQPMQPQSNSQMNPISPQMLLRYFRNGTNEVLVPYTVDFTPPVRESHGESSAIYISE